MTLDKFMRGMHIFSLYFDNMNNYCLGAEHDQFYVYATDHPIPQDSVKELKELGWFQPDVDTESDYDPTEGWSCFI